MSRTYRGPDKDRDGRDIRYFNPGYEYWTKRPGNKYGARSCGKWMKRWTHKAERREKIKDINERLRS